MKKQTIAIRTQGLTKEFIRAKKVLDNIDLSVYKGELFCLVGSNGAGKTTLIKMLCGLIVPTSGEIFINGYNILKNEDMVRSSIGLVTGDERSFYWRLTGRQNMEFFAALYNLSPGIRDKKIMDLLNILHIPEPDKIFQQYSSGIKQKLSIARALLNDPDILFIDELTKNLDPTSTRELRMFIRETLVKKHSKTVFFSTHQLYEVERLADRMAFMSRGRIMAEGTLDELKKIVGRENVSIEEMYDYFINGKG
ncbi:MAG: ABC transporter ATP-binding protein [Candidatus Omnitrophica bacterium]|nr:ABC transporter ATP-binding protein [Candidatus Omnitrophota bacterium]